MALKRFSCDNKCGFVVQDNDENELSKFVMVHSKYTHHKSLSEQEVREMTRSVLEY